MVVTGSDGLDLVLSAAVGVAAVLVAVLEATVFVGSDRLASALSVEGSATVVPVVLFSVTAVVRGGTVALSPFFSFVEGTSVVFAVSGFTGSVSAELSSAPAETDPPDMLETVELPSSLSILDTVSISAWLQAVFIIIDVTTISDTMIFWIFISYTLSHYVFLLYHLDKRK